MPAAPVTQKYSYTSVALALALTLIQSGSGPNFIQLLQYLAAKLQVIQVRIIFTVPYEMWLGIYTCVLPLEINTPSLILNSRLPDFVCSLCVCVSKSKLFFVWGFTLVIPFHWTLLLCNNMWVEAYLSRLPLFFLVTYLLLIPG